jgi:hypothetical protein
VVIPGAAPAPAIAGVEATAPLGANGAGTLLVSSLLKVGASFSTDGDSDGVADVCDNCPGSPGLGGSQTDTDGDGVGDLCDLCPEENVDDEDGDGACAPADPCPLDADDDADMDGVCGERDNCPGVANPGLLNLDALYAGDACQCGDVTAEGSVDVLDRVLVARFGAARPVPTSFMLARCSVAAPNSSCDGADDTAIRNYLAGLALPPPNACSAAGS